MVNEKRLIPFGDKVTLYDLPFGAMFAFGDDCIAVKSEYTVSNGLIKAFIIDSGEQFWGGAKTAKEQNELMVQPLELVDVDAVEMIRCKDCGHGSHVDCPEGRVWCDKMCRYMVFEGYCSYGERRKNGK